MAHETLKDHLAALRTIEILGTRIHAVTMQEALEACRLAVVGKTTLSIGVVNAAKIVKMQSDQNLSDSVMGSDLVIADGMSVVWASRVLGPPLPERVTGIDLFLELLSLADREGFSVYLLGGRADVVTEVVSKLADLAPGARVVGSRDGYFEPDQDAGVASEIGACDPDLLFVAMPTPRKEIFLETYADHLGARVRHGVGGSFDVLAGRIPRAPLRWREMGLEWLHRLVQEPRKMWRRYLVTNTLFVGMVLRAWLARMLGRRNSPAPR